MHQLQGKVYFFLPEGFYTLSGKLSEGKRVLAKSPPKTVSILSPPPPFRPPLPFGVNHAQPSSALQNSGIAWVRLDLPWGEIEKKRGEYNFHPYEKQLQKFAALGIQVLAVLGKSPLWARRVPQNFTPIAEGAHKGWADFPPRDPKDYGNFVFQTVHTLRGLVSAYEIWNEPWPNGIFFRGGTVSDYVALLHEGYRAAQSFSPPPTIVGLGGTDYIQAYRVFRQGGASFLDAISLHFYQPGLAPEKGWMFPFLDKAKGVLTRFHSSLPIWITEMGWPTSLGSRDGWPGVSLTEQAEYLARSLLLSLAHGASRIFWYEWRDSGKDHYNFEQNQGLLFHDGSPKPSFAAYAALIRKLAGKRFRRMKVSDGKWALLFSGEKESTLTLWTLGSPTPLSPQKLPAQIQIVNFLGEKLSPKKVMLTEQPLYLVSPRKEEQELFDLLN